ncbi:MAG: aspartate aminotransferase family protein [Dethiobacter sp.]|jgi:predicted acetylornithine/succinylornithine family transaminase|nr:MAG: aspartate aminotransferase family protein [Dethiobacter sp.]
MLKDEEKHFIINTYNRQPDFTLLITRGKGTLVWDENGKAYLDFVGGLAVNALGHACPPVINAAWEQMNKVIHTSNLYYSEPQVKLAKCLVENSAADRVFFCNSGAEANEAAIKLARKFSKLHLGAAKIEIITALNSFHGRTLATITATGQEKFQKGFEPLVPGFRYARFNDLDSFQSQLNDSTCAIMVEPVQGEGGVHVAAADFLVGLRRLCDENRLLLIFDEVQCGTGRTGKLFAYEHDAVLPDIITLAKALGGGFPIGAMLCREKVASGFSPGDHASTFGGNPVACAAAFAVMQEILQEGFLDDVTDKGIYFQEKLRLLNRKFPGVIIEIRGKGLMIGVELKEKGQAVQRLCQQKGLLVNCIGDRILRFLPPLNVSREELDLALEVLQNTFTEVFGGE